MPDCPVAISNFTVGPYSGVTTFSWAHTTEADKTLYVVITYLTYQGEGAITVTFNGIALTPQHVSENAAGQFHTVEIHSLVNPPVASGLIEISSTTGAVVIFRSASFNIANGPVDGCVTGVYTAMSGVTARYLYGFGYDTNALVVGWFDVFSVQAAGPYTVTDGIELHSSARFAVGYKQADGSETPIAFATSGGDTAGGEQLGLIFTIPSVCESISGGMYQPWMGRVTSLVANFPASNPLPHTALTLGTSIDAQTPHLVMGSTVRNFQIDVKVAPGVGNSRVFRLYKNGVPTSLFVTISDLETSDVLEAVDLICYRWSKVEIRETSTGPSTANTEYTYCIECETGEDGISIYGPGGYYFSFAPTLGNTGHSNIFSGIGASTGTWTLNRPDEGRIGADGSLAGILVSYNKEIGQSKYDLYVWKSTDDGLTYVRQDGSGGTPNTFKQLTRASGVAQPGGSYWFIPMNVPFLFGNQAFVAVTGTDNSDSGLNSAMMVTAIYRATTNGEWFVNGETTNNNQLFYDPHQNRNSGGFGAPESQAEYTVGPLTNPAIITGVNWGVENAPGLGQQRTWVLRHNQLSTITATISDTNHGGFADGFEPLATDDRWDVEPGEAWTTQVGWNTAWWTLRGFIAPPQFGTLIVLKAASPADGTEFPIDVGGGLSPAALNLQNGELQQYDDVPVGDGYSVSETPPAGWTLDGIAVSNGSPPDNISIGADEVVVVTVSNSEICPGLVTDPRIDGLPYDPNCPPVE